GVIFGFYKSKKSSAAEFLSANGSMQVLPTALSITVSFISAVTLLGGPSEVYLFGTMYCYKAITAIIASFVTALVFMPKFREMNFTSTYELIYMAIVLYAPALALSQTTGLNIWLCVVSIGVVCTFYSSVGGIKAVIWTDVLQSVVIIIGLLAAIIQGLITVGGFKRAFSIASNGRRIEFDNISFDPRTRHTVWAMLIGGSLNYLGTYGFNQTLVQRYLCIRSTRGAKQALLINAIGTALVILCSSLIGVIIYAYYVDCDPYTANKIESIDQIFPYFVMEVLGDKKGLPGVFLTCIFSGSLSTISSGLNSLAAVLIEDVYKGLMGRKLTDQRQGLMSKIFSVILGSFVILLTFVVSYLGPIVNATISLFGVLEGPIMGIFILGLFFPQANRRGGLIGFFASLVLLLWIFLGAQITKNQMANVSLPLLTANCTSNTNDTMGEFVLNWTTTFTTSTPMKIDPLIGLYSVSYLWYTPIAVGTVILVGMIVSYITHPLKPHEIDPKLIIPVSDMFCCCLPKSWREWLRCGVSYENYFKDKKDKNELEMTTSIQSNSIDTNSTVPTRGVSSKILRRSNMVSPAMSSVIDGINDDPSTNITT
ncbi:unnamed protein product, partial [Adineta steineri]